MLLPIALKYNEYGVLQFVRCLYFDVDVNYCQEMYAICSRDHINRDYFQNYAIKTARSRNQSISSVDQKPSYVSQTAPVVSDTQYDLATNLPMCAIDMSHARVLEISAREYLIKYSHTIKTNNITIIDGDDNIINETTQVIAPKMTFYDIRKQNVSGTPWLIRQYSCPILDDVCFSYRDYKLRRDWDIELNVQKFAPIYNKYRKTYNRSVYTVDYKGNIFKMPVEKALQLDTELGNLGEQTSLPDYLYIDCGLYEIEPFNARYSKYDQTDDIQMQGTLYGVANPETQYETLIPAQSKFAIIPTAEKLKVVIPETYAIQSIRFGDMLNSLSFVSLKDLDTIVLPRYARECSFHVKSARQIKLAEYCTKSFTGYVEHYTDTKFDVDVRNGVIMILRNAVNLECITANISSSTITGDFAPDTPPRITVTEARNLKQVRVLQSDMSRQYINKILLLIQSVVSCTIDFDCNIKHAYIQTNHGGQTMTIKIGKLVSELEIVNEEGLENIFIIQIAENSGLGKIKVSGGHTRLLYEAHRGENGKWILDAIAENAPKILLENISIETE